MNNLEPELLVIVARLEKDILQDSIKEELSSAGNENLWKKVERYAEVSTALKLYELVKD